jgi:hypothetical protein
MENREAKGDQFTDSFAKVLNRHGYGFQFSVLRKADELAKQNKSAWRLEACEFPVEVQGAGTRIDFVLSRSSWAPRTARSPLYLIAECKRANPALSNWCFVRAPFKHSNALYDTAFDHVIVESLIREDDGLRSFARETFTSNNIYHLSVEVRSSSKGDASGETGRAIEDAATQVSRSLNGFIQTIFRAPQIMEGCGSVDFLPVIFTTAQLYIADIDLSQADLQTGNIQLASEAIKSVPWIYYQYPLSPGLKHSIPPSNQGQSIATVLQGEYLRSIPVVGPSGIEQFLIQSSNYHLA